MITYNESLFYNSFRYLSSTSSYKLETSSKYNMRSLNGRLNRQSHNFSNLGDRSAHGISLFPNNTSKSSFVDESKYTDFDTVSMTVTSYIEYNYNI